MNTRPTDTAQHSTRASNFRRGALLATGVTAGVLLWNNAMRFYPFLSDDSLISLRYSQRLLAGEGLTWTAGQPVEGYSNLSWVLACALLGLFGVDLVFAARLLGALGMLGCFAALLFAGRRSWATTLGAATGVLGLASSATIGIWTIGGLEQPFVLLFLAWAVVLLHESLREPVSDEPAAHTRRERSIRWAGVALGLGTITRPDGPLFCVVLGLVYLTVETRQRDGRSALRGLRMLSLPSVVLYGGQLIVRRAYYGDWVPNTARVKVAFTDERLTAGLRYLDEFRNDAAPWLFVTCAALLLGVCTRRGRRTAFTCALVAATWIAYVAFIGGDIFPGYRHIAVVLLVGAIAIGNGLASMASGGRVHRAAAVTLALAASWVAFDAYAREPGARAYHNAIEERWEFDGQLLGEALGDAFGERSAVVAVTAAGCIPYFSGLPAIDMLGLNDHYLPRHPHPEFGRGWLGHELGDGAYILRRAPDLIVFFIGHPPMFRAGQDLVHRPGFRREYEEIRFRVHRPVGAEGATLDGRFWARVGSPRLGVERSDDAVSVPGFFVRGRAPTEFDPVGGTFRRTLTPGETGTVRLPTDTPAAWTRASVQSATGAATARREGDVILVSCGPTPCTIARVTLR